MEGSVKRDQDARIQSSDSNQDNLDDIDYKSPKKLKTLFYIKSRHTHKYFKNHPYFAHLATKAKENQLSKDQKQKQSPKKSVINTNKFNFSSNNSQSNQVQSRKEIQSVPHQFVDYPPQYGLQNTYIYLRDKSFLNKERNYQIKHDKIVLNKFARKQRRNTLSYSKTEGCEDNDDCVQKHDRNNYMKLTAAYQNKFVVSKARERNSFTSVQNHTNYKSVFNKQRNSLTKDQHRVHSIQRKHQLNYSKSYANGSGVSNGNQFVVESKSSNNLIQSHRTNRIYHSNLKHKNSTVSSPKSMGTFTLPAKYEICFIYAKRLKSFAELPHRYINFDILPFIINTFLKCKVHFKQITLKQLLFIRQCMLTVLNLEKGKSSGTIKYDIKDIINISTIKAIIQFLDQFKGKQKDYEWVETIRYFFITKEQKILQYQLNKIKDQISKLISIKFDTEFGQKEIFIFNINTKAKVDNFYDLLREGKFIIGDDQNIMTQYLKVLSQESEHQSLQNKIKKWKSIATCETVNQSTERGNKGDNGAASAVNQQSRRKIHTEGGDQKKLSFLSTKGRLLTDQKFNNLFEQFKVRQMKRLAKNIPTSLNIMEFNGSKSFVEKASLKKIGDIFE